MAADIATAMTGQYYRRNKTLRVVVSPEVVNTDGRWFDEKRLLTRLSPHCCSSRWPRWISERVVFIMTRYAIGDNGHERLSLSHRAMIMNIGTLRRGCSLIRLCWH